MEGIKFKEISKNQWVLKGIDLSKPQEKSVYRLLIQLWDDNIND